ncbi:MAG: C39 family peptidase [Pseudomonadota bacterium]
MIWVRAVLLFVVPYLLLASNLAWAQGTQSFYEGNFAGAYLNIPIESYRDRQFARVVRQQYDFSCGSAALATLLTYHYDIPRSESNLFVAMWEAGEQDNIRKRGFSLLDMKRLLERGGVTANGYQLPFEKLKELRIPGIALVNVNGYAHFVVVKGVRDDQVLLGDPSIGLIVRSKEEFLNNWNGTILFIQNFTAHGRASWNAEKDWSAHPDARTQDLIALPDLAVETLHATRFLNSGFSVGAR